jgi:hypothetical protein
MLAQLAGQWGLTKNIIFTEPTRAAKAGQKSLVPASQANAMK